jgi:hypothetical protein
MYPRPLFSTVHEYEVAHLWTVSVGAVCVL